MADQKQTIIALPALDRNGNKAQLKLITRKFHGSGLCSQATVEFTTPQGFTTFLLFGDYSQQVILNRDVRATQRAIDTQHAQAFTPAAIDAITGLALHFYEVKDAEELNAAEREATSMAESTRYANAMAERDEDPIDDFNYSGSRHHY